jgi:hypothetical protein
MNVNTVVLTTSQPLDGFSRIVSFLNMGHTGEEQYYKPEFLVRM